MNISDLCKTIVNKHHIEVGPDSTQVPLRFLRFHKTSLCTQLLCTCGKKENYIKAELTSCVIGKCVADDVMIYP